MAMLWVIAAAPLPDSRTTGSPAESTTATVT